MDLNGEFNTEELEEFKELEKNNALEREKIMNEIVGKIDKIFTADGLIKKYKEDYIPRESQIEASKKMVEILTNRDHMILEGPCGFGKTFSYLIPIFLYADYGNRSMRAIIVTNGISLQEQLFYKDIPFINKMFRSDYATDITFAMLKGKGNFLCQNKLSELELTRNYSTPETIKILQMYKRGRIANGDISNLDFVPDYATMRDISCVEEGECKGSACGFYGQCYYQLARQKADAAEIVVTNYHMLFSDLKTGGRILGAYDVLIFDEAHEIPGIYRDFLEEKISMDTFNGIRNKVSEIGNMDEDIKENFVGRIAMDWVLQSAQDFFYRVQKSLFTNPAKDDVRMLDVTTPLCQYPDAQQNFLSAVDHLKNSLGQIQLYCEQKIESITNAYGDDVFELPAGVKEDYNNYAGIFNKVVTQREKLEKIEKIIENYGEIVKSSKYVYWVENKEKKSAMMKCQLPSL
jgi:Rad3-related DNA helicase